MSNSNISWIYSALLLATAATFSLANDKSLDLEIFKQFANGVVHELKVVSCVANSCDPEIFNKMFQVANIIEDFISDKPAFGETQEFKTFKLDKSFEYFAPKFLTLEPRCKDLSYVCPYGVVVQTPQCVNDYIDETKALINAAKCITAENIQEAIDILGKGVSYLEQFKDHKGNYFERVLPGIGYATKEFRKFCGKV